MTDFDIAEADRLLKTTKQVRKRMDLTRPVPRELLLECIEVASLIFLSFSLMSNSSLSLWYW